MGSAGLRGGRRLRKRGGRVMRASTVCETRARRAHTLGAPTEHGRTGGEWVPAFAWTTEAG